MIYLLENDSIKKDAFDDAEGKAYLCSFGFEEFKAASSYLGINERFVEEYLRSSVCKYESHDELDFLSLNIPDDFVQSRTTQRVCIYFKRNCLVFVCNDCEVLNSVITQLEEEGLKNISLGKILYLFLDKLTYDDALVLEDIEQSISEIEEELITSKKNDLINDIVTLRKKLMLLKRYYEQLLEISEGIEQNDNGFIDKKVQRYFRLITNRADRLYHSVLNLRDYVTQVREAYQAQIDINLNSIMKVFTVITSIFLPLTLIVGWYGMNLKMPEYSWNYSYPAVIGVCIIVTTVSVFYFKKNKWF